jgi:general stress protein 26
MNKCEIISLNKGREESRFGKRIMCLLHTVSHDSPESRKMAAASDSHMSASIFFIHKKQKMNILRLKKRERRVCLLFDCKMR